MKKKGLVLLFLFLTFFCNFLNAQQIDRYSSVKIYLDNRSLADLQALCRDLDHGEFLPDENAFLTSLRKTAIRDLRRHNVRIAIVVEDEAQDFMNRNDLADFNRYRETGSGEQFKLNFEATCGPISSSISTPAAFTPGSMGGYYTYSEMITKINEMKSSYPSLVDTFTIGFSWEGRRLIGVKISDNADIDEPESEVLFLGLQHAREAITMTSLIFTMQYLLQNYNLDSRIKDLVDNREQFFIPCMNPDGYVYNQTTNPGGGGTWRKNRRNNGNGTYGVDLNRNYGVDWGCCGGGSSTTSSDTYWGPFPFSEPETQALRNFVSGRNFTTGLDQHSYGGYYSLPYGINGAHTYSAVDSQYYAYTSALLGRYNCHRAGNSMQTVGYNVAGGVKDWLILGDIGLGTKGKIYSFTSEANGGSFWPSASNIIPLCKELCFQNLQTAYTAGSYAELQDMNDLSVTNISGNFNFLLRNIGLDNQPVTVSLIPLENIAVAGDPVVVTTGDYFTSVSGAISYTLVPGIQNGERIRYVWSSNSNGVRTLDTITLFYNALTLLADNMEGNFTTNWNSSTWGFTNASAFSGSKSMSESPSGRYPAKSTRTVTYKNTLNLNGASAAYLSFWVNHESQNCYDNLKIEVSTNGKQFVPLCGRNTVSESKAALGGKPALTGIRRAWTREIVNLSAYLGSSQLRLRFNFISNSDTLKGEGFFIDDVKVIKSNAPLARPALFVNVEAALIDKNLVKLNWEAYTDNGHSHFEVEKSGDGISFIPIGKVNTAPPFIFFDNDAKEGPNYYRIRQVNKDQSERFSTSIKIKVGAGYSVLLFPNPMANYANLMIESDKKERVRVEIFDTDGKLIQVMPVILAPGFNSTRIDASALARGLYIIRITDSNNQMMDILRIVRQ